MKQSIGGYFELELNKRNLFHKDAVALNSGRNSFEYILLANKYKKAFIPLYSCDVIIQPLLKNNITYEFYTINENLEPVFDFEQLKPSECFLYTNYFGLKDNYVQHITSRFSCIIIDNAQSFFSMPQNGADSFYSTRKFFGLPDGGYSYCKKSLDIELEIDQTSIKKMGHLMKRLAFDAELGYEDFKRNEESLNDQPVKLMSQLTKKLLTNIDYETVKKRRTDNFNFLHMELGKTNKLTSLINHASIVGPLFYPYWVDNGKELRIKLQKNRIFTPVYWQNVLMISNKDTTEFDLADNMVLLPIDQRYDFSDLDYVLNLI